MSTRTLGVCVGLSLAACGSSASSSGAGNLPACGATVQAYCDQTPGAICPSSWSQAVSLASYGVCAGGVYLYACHGLDIANCPGDEGGGRTLAFDVSTHSLIAVAQYPSLVGGGSGGCYVGPESLRSSLQSGPPDCPTGPLYDGTGQPVPGSGVPSAEMTCAMSGGSVAMGTCCAQAMDLPDTCSAGACNCTPANSRSLLVCNCPAGKCFDGTVCC